MNERVFKTASLGAMQRWSVVFPVHTYLIGLVLLALFVPELAVALMLVSLTSWLLFRQGRVEMENDGLRLRTFYRATIAYENINRVDSYVYEPSRGRFWFVLRLSPFTLVDFEEPLAEVRLRKAQLVVMLMPFPVVVPLKRLRFYFPLEEHQRFVADTRVRIGQRS